MLDIVGDDSQALGFGGATDKQVEIVNLFASQQPSGCP